MSNKSSTHRMYVDMYFYRTSYICGHQEIHYQPHFRFLSIGMVRVARSVILWRARVSQL